MKSVEATGRWGMFLLSRGRGKVGLLTLVVAAIALCLARPASIHGQQKQGDLVGRWVSTGVINGQVFTQVSVCNADGTFACRTVAGNIVLNTTGKFTYANGIQTLVYDNGWFEQDSVVWINPNQVMVTCLRSNVPGAVGLKIVANRVR
jgi:hypothetical protein